MTALVLLDRRVSGNAWRVRLLAGLAGISLRRVEVDIMAGEQKSPAFLAINPLGQVPVLVQVAGGTVVAAVPDSTAALIFLAAAHAPEFLAEGPIAMAQQQRWLAISGHEHQVGIRFARGMTRFGFPGSAADLERARSIGRKALEAADLALFGNDFLAGNKPTVADIAAYTYTRLAPEGGIETGDLQNLGRWIARIEGLPGYAAIDAGDGPIERWPDFLATLLPD